MAENNFFKMAAERAKKRFEELLPGNNFNVNALENMFRENGVEFTWGYLDQMTESADLMVEFARVTQQPG